MKPLGILVASPLMAGGAAHAGSFGTPVIEASSIHGGDTWSDSYADAQLHHGNLALDVDGVDDATGGGHGICVGHDHPLPGKMVVGGQIAFDHSSADNDTWQVERLFPLRAKLGHAHENGLLHGLAGYAHVRTECAECGHGKSSGAVFGIGADYAVSDCWLVGGTWEAYNLSAVSRLIPAIRMVIAER